MYAEVIDLENPFKLSEDFIDRLRLEALKYKITRAEFRVLVCLCQGFTNQEIADALFLSHGTIRSHTASLMDRTNSRNRTQLIIRLVVMPQESLIQELTPGVQESAA